MTHYPVANLAAYSAYNVTNIKNIILTKSIVSGLRKFDKGIVNWKNKRKWKKKGFSLLRNRLDGKLSRLGPMYRAFINKIALEPIKLVYYVPTHCPCNKSGKYTIVDGRHRFVMSYIFGYSHIPYVLL